MNIVIMGPPGVGKGTQAEGILTGQGLVHIATGGILRQAVHDGTELGRKIATMMAAGELVPDDLMMEIIRGRLQDPAAQGGWLLDGFPRTARQADGLLELLAEIGAKIDRVVVLDAPDDVILQRLGGRLTCRNCGHVTSAHKSFGAPKFCSVCGKNELHTRVDDKEETILHRLEVFRARTWPAAERLGLKYKLAKIDGRGTPEEVKQRIARVLE